MLVRTARDTPGLWTESNPPPCILLDCPRSDRNSPPYAALFYSISLFVFVSFSTQTQNGDNNPASGANPNPDRFMGFGELLRQAEQAQAQASGWATLVLFAALTRNILVALCEVHSTVVAACTCYRWRAQDFKPEPNSTWGTSPKQAGICRSESTTGSVLSPNAMRHSQRWPIVSEENQRCWSDGRPSAAWLVVG